MTFQPSLNMTKNIFKYYKYVTETGFLQSPTSNDEVQLKHNLQPMKAQSNASSQWT